MTPFKYRRVFFTLLKTAVGAFFVAYVIRANLVDFRSVAGVLQTPVFIFSSLFIVFLITFCMSVRIYLISRTSFPSISLLGMFEITMVGQFFGTFLPGAVGSDIVRGWYLTRQCEKNVAFATQAILWDRVIGLTVTCLAAAIASSFLKNHEVQTPILYQIRFLSYGASLVLILTGLFFYYVAPRVKFPILNNSKVVRAWKMLTSFQPDIAIVLWSFCFSMLCIFLTIVLGAVCGNVLGLNVSFGLYAVIVPIGVLVSAVPLLPLGIGLGQVAYSNLFLWFGISGLSSGATLCTLMQCSSILFSLSGLFPYIRMSMVNKHAELPSSER